MVAAARVESGPSELPTAQRVVRAPWKTVAIPTEHGGWGLTLEPVVLGLLVTTSWSGLLLGLAAFVAFVARTPIKVVLVDRFRHRDLPRTRLALRIAAAELVVLVALVAGAARLAEGSFWWPLAVAVPLIGIELWFDMRSRSRRLVPELAGSIGICAVGAAIVLAGGGSTVDAAGVWLVLAARSVASIPFVRLQLQRAKQHPHRRWAVDLTQVGAALVVVAASVGGLVPVVAAVAVGGLVAVQLVLDRLTPPKAAVIGAQQMVLGLAVVLATGLGFLAP